MKMYQSEKDELQNVAKEDPAPYGNATDPEEARLERVMNMSDMEKLKSFTRMLRMNAIYKSAKIIHKD